ncbi:MAG: hypothetical protein CMP81_09890 [Fulvimarina sp.]|nr:hypothetical protein [Fulvimarina sp.]
MKHRRRFEWSSAAVGIIAGVGGTLFLTLLTQGPKWFFRSYEELKEWQTLAGGMLAVLAASFTIREMERIDAEQKARHRELLRMQLHDKTMDAWRLAEPQAADLRTQAKRMADALDDYNAVFRPILATIEGTDSFYFPEDGTESLLRSAQTSANTIGSCATAVGEIFDRDVVIAGQRLFPPTVVVRRDRIEKQIKYVGERNSARWAIESDEKKWKEATALLESAGGFISELMLLADDLDTIKRAYDVDRGGWAGMRMMENTHTI